MRRRGFLGVLASATAALASLPALARQNPVEPTRGARQVIRGEPLEFEVTELGWTATLAWVSILPGTLRVFDHAGSLIFDDGKGVLRGGCFDKPVGGVLYETGEVWMSYMCHRPVDLTANYAHNDSWARVPERRFVLDSGGFRWVEDDHA